jgi:hypothetical protein
MKVVPMLFLTEHYTMKMHWGSGGIAHTFLIVALDGSEWSASCPGCFTPRERAPGTHWIGGWVGPRASLNTVVMRNILSPTRTQTPDHPAHSPVQHHWYIPVPYIIRSFMVYTISNTIRVTKSMRMRWVGYVACITDEKCLKERDYLKDWGVLMNLHIP